MHHFNAGAAARAAVPACRGAAVGRHAKKRALRLGGEQHPAVERHKRRGAIVRDRVDRPRDEAAAGAGLANEHHAGGRSGGFARLREHLAHGGRLADKLKGWSVSAGIMSGQSFAL